MTLSSEAALIALVLSSLVYLVLVFFSIWLTRSLELRLLLVGLPPAWAAAWWGLVGGERNGAMEGRRGEPAAVSLVAPRREAVAVLGRIAVLLIVGSVAVAVLG